MHLKLLTIKIQTQKFYNLIIKKLRVYVKSIDYDKMISLESIDISNSSNKELVYSANNESINTQIVNSIKSLLQ